MVMHSLQELLHTDILHSPNCDQMPKIREIADRTLQITVQVLVLDILGTHKVMITTGTSREVASNMLDLTKDIISGTCLLCSHPPHS